MPVGFDSSLFAVPCRNVMNDVVGRSEQGYKSNPLPLPVLAGSLKI